MHLLVIEVVAAQLASVFSLSVEPMCVCQICLRQGYGKNTHSMTTKSPQETKRLSAAAAWRAACDLSAAGWWSTVEIIKI